MAKCKETFTNKTVKMTKRNELTISNRVYHKKKETMKSTSDLPHEIFSALSNVASSFECVIPKAFLSSSSDAI